MKSLQCFIFEKQSDTIENRPFPDRKKDGFFSLEKLYIFTAVAENNNMENAYVYGAVAGAVLLLFPVFLSLDAYTDLTKNKLFFSVYAFRFFKVIGGYICLEKEGLAVHISRKKAIFVPYAQMQNERKKFEITAGFQIITFKASLEIGDEDFPTAAFFITAVLRILSGTVFPALQKGRKFMRLENGVLLRHGGNAAMLTLHLVTAFNLLTVGIALTKILLEAIINLWQKKRKKNIRQSRA